MGSLSSPDTTGAAWTLLLVAAVFEIGFALGMKWTQGFSRPGPVVVTLVLAAISLLLLTRALLVLPVGTAYAAWTGIGAVGTAILGMLVFGEPVTPGRVASLGCVILGVIGLRYFSAGEAPGRGAVDASHAQVTSAIPPADPP